MCEYPMNLLCFVIFTLIAGSQAVAQEAGKPTRATDAKGVAIAPGFGMLLTRVGQSSGRSRRRSSYFQFDDPVHSKLVDGTLSQFRPTQDQAVRDDSPWQWKRVEFDENGGIEQRGLYLYAPLESDKQRVVILDSASHGEMYFNGEPRAANVYGRSYFHVPVPLNKGTNHLLLRGGRGSFKVRCYDPPAAVFLNTADTTLPDLLASQAVNTWGAIVVINATSEWANGFGLELKAPGLTTVETPVPPIGPLSIRKVRLNGTASRSRRPSTKVHTGTAA